jgi:hypothetical protein
MTRGASAWSWTDQEAEKPCSFKERRLKAPRPVALQNNKSRTKGASPFVRLLLLEPEQIYQIQNLTAAYFPLNTGFLFSMKAFMPS